ncbi:hypothetical protein COE15_19400 [Bacillus cereus]|nr:hypothetical protein CN288_00740 [Bacillus sp. AFS023182]PGX96554.1 hypothetical protein COE15_19400 [Bacillus cereus]
MLASNHSFVPALLKMYKILGKLIVGNATEIASITYATKEECIYSCIKLLKEKKIKSLMNMNTPPLIKSFVRQVYKQKNICLIKYTILY